MIDILAEASGYAVAAGIGTGAAAFFICIAKLVPWFRNKKGDSTGQPPPCGAHGARLDGVERSTKEQWDKLDGMATTLAAVDERTKGLTRNVDRLVNHFLPPALLIVCLLTGCADVRLAATYGSGHADQADKRARALRDSLPAGPSREQADLVVFDTSRTVAWTSATLRLHGGTDPEIYIPKSPAERKAVLKEDIDLHAFNEAVDKDLANKAAVGNWLGLLGLGGGASIGSTVLALFLRHRKKVGPVIRDLRDTVAGKDRALDGMNRMIVQGIRNKERRRQLGAPYPDAIREHELRENGGRPPPA